MDYLVLVIGCGFVSLSMLGTRKDMSNLVDFS